MNIKKITNYSRFFGLFGSMYVKSYFKCNFAVFILIIAHAFIAHPLAWTSKMLIFFDDF